MQPRVEIIKQRVKGSQHRVGMIHFKVKIIDGRVYSRDCAYLSWRYDGCNPLNPPDIGRGCVCSTSLCNKHGFTYSHSRTILPTCPPHECCPYVIQTIVTSLTPHTASSMSVRQLSDHKQYFSSSFNVTYPLQDKGSYDVIKRSCCSKCCCFM